MNLSVSLYSCNPRIKEGKSDIYGVMDFLRENGVNYVEIVDMYAKSDDETAKIKEYLNKTGMKVSSYSASNNFVADENKRAEQIEYIKKCCDIAKYFDTNIVRVFSGNLDETRSYDECFELIVDSFKKCVGYAEEKGVYLCLENHGLLAGKPEQIKSIIDAVGSPNLKLTADTGNFNIVGADPYKAVEMLVDDIGHVHFKDMIETEDGWWTSPDGRKFLGCTVGEGVVELDRIVELLSKRGYNGYISLEYEAPENECFEGVKKSIEYTQSLINKYYN